MPNVISETIQSIFGDKGITGSVVEILKDTGILKDPEMVFKASQALRDYETKINDQQVESERIAQTDRDSARKREIEVKDHTTRNLAYLYAVGFFVIVGTEIYIGVMGIHIPDGIQRTLDMLFGIMISMILGVKEYYFGSSSGSAEKNNTIKNILNKTMDSL